MRETASHAILPGTDADHTARTERSISQRLTDIFGTLGKREQDVAREILRQYPISALCTVAELARRSGVSTATVLRLVQRLGLDGYGRFQEAVKADVSCLLDSPQQRLSAQAHDDENGGSLLRALIDTTVSQLQRCHDPVMEADFRAAVALLANPRHRLWCVGGHRSRHVAALLAEYLGLLRPRVQLIDGPAEGWARHLLEMDAQSVVIATDIRRYQPSLLRLGTRAAERGAHVIAISDSWAEKSMFGAELLFRMPSASPSPIESHGGQLLLAEALVGGLAREIGAPLQDRLERGEELNCTSPAPAAHPFDTDPGGMT